jgi:hypothetical protein
VGAIRAFRLSADNVYQASVILRQQIARVQGSRAPISVIGFALGLDSKQRAEDRAVDNDA